MLMTIAAPAVFDPLLSDVNFPLNAISQQQADELFSFFKQHPLFNWENANNGCEGRADAVCVLLDEWHIPNYKAWVFSGAYLKKNAGQLKNYWNYHVAPLLAVEKDGQILYNVLDPAIADSLLPVEEWATAVTQVANTYYFIRESHWYIFPKHVTAKKWHSRNKQNRKWMIQGLAGINGLTKAGKASLTFNKAPIKKITRAFEHAKKDILVSDVLSGI
ncbi:MAG: protein-glutamine glutaminase family protein [Sediminibacterium sp.]